jgi:hypothetical protein
VREIKNAYKIFVGKPEGKGLLGGLRCRWEDSITVDIKYDVKAASNFSWLRI